MIRLRVTDLDQWLKYTEPEQEEFEISTEDFIAYLRREDSPGEAMIIGRAFHSALENQTGELRMLAAAWAQKGNPVELDELEQDGYRFQFLADCPIDVPLFREQMVEKEYHSKHGPVLLRGKLDGLSGIDAIDYKLTFSQFNAERYAASMQWRAYLDMTGARRFRYGVFRGKPDRIDPATIKVEEFHPFDQWTYPGIGADVQRRVSQLADFVASHVPELIKGEN